MAMTIKDAHDINLLLHWIRGDCGYAPDGAVSVSAEATLNAGKRLAEKAYKTLSAGLAPHQVAVDMRGGTARYMDAVAATAGELWNSGCGDPYDVLSARQRELLDQAAKQYRADMGEDRGEEQ